VFPEPDFRNVDATHRDRLKRRGTDWDNVAGAFPLLQKLESLTLVNAKCLSCEAGNAYGDRV